MSMPVVAARGADDTAERGERIAKVMARAGLCSRRDAESWIESGRVELNGQVLTTPAITVTGKDKVVVDGNPLPTRERTRLWLYHKPRGLVTTNKDPEGRPTVFARLPKDLPRVLTVGRLDINTEGLLLLTNDGGLARVLELPSTGWLRRYRVRAFGRITQADLDSLKDGIAIEGVLYGAIEATLDKEQGGNSWMTVGLREGKNREVKRVLEHLGLTVNRLIRLSYGPFQLMDMPEGEVREIRGRVLRDQLGETLAEEAGADFEAPLFNMFTPEPEKKSSGVRQKSGRSGDRPSGERAPGGRATGGRATGGRRSEAGEAGARSAGTRSAGTRSAGARTSGDRSTGQKPSGERREGGQGKWMTAREGKSETDRHKASKSKRADSARAERDKGGKPGKRKPSGPKLEKVSPRSQFRMTSAPRPRKDAAQDRPSPPSRRIWGDEGLVEDKRQQTRSDIEKRDRNGPPKGGKGPRGGGRS
ncbi:pseudouridine synthase [Roseibium sp.]